MKKAFVFIVILALFSLELASSSSYEIELNQYQDRILEKHKLILDNKEEIEIILPKDFSSLDVKNEYLLKENKLIINDSRIEFSFINNEAIEKGKNYYLTRKIPGIAVDKLEIKLYLDEGFIVSEVFPKQERIESDGRKIIISWNFKNVKKEDSFVIFSILENAKDGFFWVYLIAIASVIAIIILTKFFLIKEKKLKEKAFKKAEHKKQEIMEKIGDLLLENEKKVVEELEKENNLWQKQLQLRTGLSKVKLSRILKNLEKRKLIKKINFGKTNRILLKK